MIKGAFHGGPEFDWFRAFLYLEAYVPETVAPDILVTLIFHS